MAITRKDTIEELEKTYKTTAALEQALLSLEVNPEENGEPDKLISLTEEKQIILQAYKNKQLS